MGGEKSEMDVLETIHSLIRTNDVCVLSTVFEGKPHCSLMSYVVDDECREFYMITRPGSMKYRNLEQNGSVSLLIDSREQEPDGRREGIWALTVSGEFRKIADGKKEKEILALLLDRNPHLREFAEKGAASVFAVRVKTLQLLEGVDRSHFVEVQ